MNFRLPLTTRRSTPGLAAALLCSLLSSQAMAATLPDPGEWQVRTTETHEGNPAVLKALATAKSLRDAARQGLPPGKTAPAARPNSVEDERDCITAQDLKEMQPRQVLQDLISKGMEGWKCQVTDQGSSGEQLQYSCRNASNQTSKGQATMSLGARTFKYEVNGTVEHKAGDPSSRVTSRWVVEGRWLASKCSAESLAQRER